MARHWRWLIRERTPGARLVPEMAPRPAEPVFRKMQYSAFERTRLEEWLARRRAGTLVLAGVMTHLCVETTARQAFVREIDVVVPVDACAAPDETLHLGALRAIGNGFGVVPATRDVVDRLCRPRARR
jgi:nicotinamidase-related amidase